MMTQTDLSARHSINQVLTSNSPVELSIVMPCLNEAETIGTCIEKAQRSLRELAVAGEVVIADNGSTDGSQEIAEGLGARLVHVADKGYGNALMAGIANASGRYVIMGDADDSYDFTNLGPFLEKLRHGYDLVMGNRFEGGIEPGAMPALHRYLGNPVLSGIGRLFFHTACRDFHCGLRGFNRAAIVQLDLRTTGMEFASEMVARASLSRMKIAEVPTILSAGGRNRPPHLRSWQDGWRHLRFLLLYSPRWLFLYPGTLAMLLGLAVGGLLLPGPLSLGSVTLDVHTLLYAALAVIIGFQAVSFAVCTKVFAVSAGLLPEDPRLTRAFRVITLEAGLIVGGMLVLAGLLASIYALSTWRATSFGPLNPLRELRLVIPAATSLSLGCQVVLTSFFLSVLGLKRK